MARHFLLLLSILLIFGVLVRADDDAGPYDQDDGLTSDDLGNTDDDVAEVLVGEDIEVDDEGVSDLDDDDGADDDAGDLADDVDDVSTEDDLDKKAEVEIEKRILMGPKADIKDYPWLVGIKRYGRGGINCGGSLIAKNLVLTAAHCFYARNKKTRKFVLRDDAKGYRIVVKQSFVGRLRRDHVHKVSAVRVHKGWDVTKATKSPNDIAILKLEKPIETDETTQVIALPKDQSDSPPTGSTCHVAGWGRTQKGRGARNLYAASLRTDPMSECISWFGGAQLKTHHPEKRLCAGGHSNQNVCKGDSGGPFSCKRGNEKVLYGVVSFGSMKLHGCYRGGTKPTAPSVYTRVSYYLDWIKQNSL